MSKNRAGALTGNLEWGSKARKREDAIRGLNNRARREAIADQADEPMTVNHFLNSVAGSLGFEVES